MRINWVTVMAPTATPDGRATSQIASIRFRVISPAEQLREHVHRAVTVSPTMTEAQAKAASENADVVVISKTFQQGTEDIAARAKALGAAVVFDVCDNYYRHPELGSVYRNMSLSADRVVCNTPAMARVIQEETGVQAVIIPDPYEGPQAPPKFAPGPKLKLLWFGHQSNFDGLQAAMEDLVDYSRRRPLELTVLSRADPQLVEFVKAYQAELPDSLKISFAVWSLEAQAAELDRCDVVILPSAPKPEKTTKSSNRIVQALRAGRATVAYPLPSYVEFAPWTPIVVKLSEGLASLEEQAGEVPGRIAQAQAHIERCYAPAVVGDQWRKMFAGLAPKAARP